jgi:hypothetical protein
VPEPRREDVISERHAVAADDEQGGQGAKGAGVVLGRQPALLIEQPQCVMVPPQSGLHPVALGQEHQAADGRPEQEALGVLGW